MWRSNACHQYDIMSLHLSRSMGPRIMRDWWFWTIIVKLQSGILMRQFYGCIHWQVRVRIRIRSNYANQIILYQTYCYKTIIRRPEKQRYIHTSDIKQDLRWLNSQAIRISVQPFVLSNKIHIIKVPHRMPFVSNIGLSHCDPLTSCTTPQQSDTKGSAFS